MTTNMVTSGHQLSVGECLETLEDSNLFTKKSLTLGFQNLHLILQEVDPSVKLTGPEVIRILSVFEKCLKLDIKSIPHALTTVLSLLKNAKVISNIPAQDLLPSALAVLHMLKTLCALETRHLRTLGEQVLVSYPDEVLTLIIRHNCSELLDIFEDIRPQILQGTSSMRSVLKILLLKLPPQEQKQLIEQGLPTWFHIISVIMDVCTIIKDDDPLLDEYTESLEVLTEALLEVNYFECPQWKNEILKNLCDSKIYPATMLRLLEINTSVWHRYWIVFVKLLKNTITSPCPYGIPIQRMLEVVESAFKMYSPVRCKAFQCWDVLIDSLSSDANERSTPRYLKLLLIPLKPHNAKTIETSRAKFFTWWNLIRKFQAKLDYYPNDVLFEFLQFMFGKKAYDIKHTPLQVMAGVGQTYNNIGSLCLQAFAEIVGHHANCNYCSDLPKLNEGMIKPKLFTSQWEKWLSALKTAIFIANMMYETDKNHIVNEPMQILCVWRAFVISIAELPANGVRKDIFDELMQMLIDLLPVYNANRSTSGSSMPDLVFSLTLSLMEDNEKIRNLLNSGSKEVSTEDLPICRIISIMTHPKLHGVFERYNIIKMVEILKPLTDFAVDSKSVTCCLGYLVLDSSSLKLWTALANSMNEAEIASDGNTLRQMLTWPIKALSKVEVDKYTATAWQTMYSTYVTKSTNTQFDKSIYKLIKEDRNKPSYFKVTVTVCILKNRLLYPGEDVGVYSELLENLTSEMRLSYEQYDQLIPMLVDTVVVMLEKVTSSSDEKLANLSLNSVKNILEMFILEMKSKDEGCHEAEKIFVMLNNIFNAIQPMSKISEYSHIICGFLEDLREYVKPLTKDSCWFAFVGSKFLLSKVNGLRANCPIDTVKDKVNEGIDSTEKSNKTFTSPNINKVIKKSKKKEAIIVNTVTENGEEYAVVKSNWKFNPKNLTENQKEKLQRKREDIPALYQDLSQSQDEFKLSKWKSDSQDTTTSSNSKSSKITTNEDATNILKVIQNSDVVPNIMQNILSQNDKIHTNGSLEPNTAADLQTDKSKKVGRPSPSTPKSTKSPRMALKDRVFRNVRNLIEKSSPKDDTTDAVVGGSQIKIAPSTANIINSASPLISAERPNRMKKIPKKYADVQLFGLVKKRRHSQTDSLCCSENEIENYNDGEDKNTDKAVLSVDNCNTDIQPIVKQSDITEVEQAESVQDVSGLDDISVLQQEITEGALDEIITENICGAQKNEDTSVIIKKYNSLNRENFNDHDKNHKENLQKNNPYNDQLKSNNSQCTKNGVVQDIQINDSPQHSQENYEVQNVQMDDVAQNCQKCDLNLTKDTITDAKESIDSNNEKTPVQKTKEASQKSTTKKSTAKKSRIEKELAIDMVEGNPFLKIQSEKRLTRKQLIESGNVSRRKSVPQKSNKMKARTKNLKSKENELVPNSQESFSVTVEETQERNTLPENTPCCEDVIESSQDSDFTTVTVKSTKWTPYQLPVVSVERLEISDVTFTKTQDLLQDSDCEILSETNKSINQETKDDIELPKNKTAEVDKNQSEHTEDMDTEPVNGEMMIDDVIIINGDRESPITINTERSVGLETQELAEADTQPNDPADFIECISETSPTHPEVQSTPLDITETMSPSKLASTDTLETQEDFIEISTESNCSKKDSKICSPLKDDSQRKQDFLNNTFEISPIKVQSPDKDKTSPEKNVETSSDYLVVKLSSPVHSNGEPFTSQGSPEIFTEDKISPDKRDQSPPRVEVAASSSSSPSSSLSLKKNRPQTLRPSGRGAHMVGLCIPENSLNSRNNSEKAEVEEPKKPNTSTPARRNLRVLYNSVSDNSDALDDNEQDNFLKLKKALPSIDSSPAVPILKRKIDIVDDTTASPASKRKRVSFHDPPVSTTVSVQKYIKPDCIEPPTMIQKITRSSIKPPKRLDNAFKLDTVLSKAIESFQEQPADSLTNDTNMSLDATPAVEMVITSELNDTDPICPDLIDCNDPIENIAVELSSLAMKDLFIKELDGKVQTVGDLAKMTELEVNRLCIKAPKIQVAKKVLAAYVQKRVTAEVVLDPLVLDDETAIATDMDEDMIEPEAVNTTVETQTDEVSVSHTSSQTTDVMKVVSTQTNSVSTSHSNTQTLETGFKATSAIISSCLLEREDFVEKLGDKLATDTIVNMLANKVNISTSNQVLTQFMNRQSENLPSDERKDKELTVLKDFLLERFDHRDLILFCSKLFQGLYDKSA